MTDHLDRIEAEAKSAYWLRFLNGRWLVYRHEVCIANFPAEQAVQALALLRTKQAEPR